MLHIARICVITLLFVAALHGALALDATTPIVVTKRGVASGSNSMATASFTPPADSVLVVTWGGNASGSYTLSNIAITDNRGTHLTYTPEANYGNLTGDVMVYVWSAPVTTSVAMTVTVSWSSTSGDAQSPYMLHVAVFTGADTTDPIGAKGGGRNRTTNLSGTAAQYTSTRDGSWGWVAYADWNADIVPTVPATETVDDSYRVTGNATHALIKNNDLTATSGTTVTLSTSTPTSSLQVSWAYYEVLPTAGGGGTIRKRIIIAE